MMDEKLLVIFSGYNQRAVIAFLRCLAKNYIDNYLIIAASDKDTILLTPYSDKVFAIRHYKELNKDEIVHILHSIKSQYDINELVIVPSTESLNRFMLDFRSELEMMGCIVPLVKQKLYETISDKHAFWNVCDKKGLLVPKIINESCTFYRPFVAKPKKYYSDNGKVYSPIIVQNERQYQSFMNNYSITDFDLQEYLAGESYYLLYYFSKNGTIIKYSQKNLAQQPEGKSILVAEGADIHNLGISEKYEDLLNSVNYCGFIMIELRKHNDSFYMIEANPRLWGPSQFVVDSHIPIFEAFLYDYGFIPSIPQCEVNRNARYLWSGGAKDDLLSDDSCVWHADGKEIFKENYLDFIKYDFYNRLDTKRIIEIERVKHND